MSPSPGGSAHRFDEAAPGCRAVSISSRQTCIGAPSGLPFCIHAVVFDQRVGGLPDFDFRGHDPKHKLEYAGLRDKNDDMGTAQVQGELWGARAKDWVEANEPAWLPIYRAVFAQADVGAGTRLLDIGCGAGGALLLARELGAEVFGIDASANLVNVARSRLPSAEIKVGEMEELPFFNRDFDAVTGINSFQFAGDIRQALREAGRVCKSNGSVTVLVWGSKDSCELMTSVLPPVLALLPPTPPPAEPPADLSAPGTIESIMQAAELTPKHSSDLNCPLVFPDRNTAKRAILSAMARVIRHAGEEAVARAIDQGLERVPLAAGRVMLKSKFRIVTGRRIDSSK